MNQRHKHADVIIAWANGAEIEFKVKATGDWRKTDTPSWQEDYEYRVKQPAKKYRLALFLSYGDDGETYAAVANTQKSVDFYEQNQRFVRWLTDWIEYEE